jgi:pilus assembly protein CpaB
VSRRARGLAFLGAAAACAGLAASAVSRFTNDVRAQVGPLVPAVIASRDVAPGRPLTPDDVTRRLVPERYAPRDAIRDLTLVTGHRTAVALHAGDYLSGSVLTSAPREGGEAAASSGRVIEVSVAGAASLGDALGPGAHVDVLITTDSRTYLALQDAELISFAGEGEAKAVAGLRVSLRQAVLLTAAQSFARELRLVPRPDGDRARLGPVGVKASELGR